MDDAARLKLQSILEKDDGVVDQTQLIRKLQHSHILRDNIDTLLEIKERCGNDSATVLLEGMNECGFLHKYYTDIFNKIMNDEIDVAMLNRFLDILQKIENNEVDQHEGSFEVGTILKEMYVDSALKKSKKLEEAHGASAESVPEVAVRTPSVSITYAEFKAMQQQQQQQQPPRTTRGAGKKHKGKKHGKKR